MFLRDYVPQSLKDAWRAEFEHLRQGTMTVSEYDIRFSDLATHAPALVSTGRERVYRFTEGLIPSIRSSMALELEMSIPYQQVGSISRRVEGMLARDREEREAKRSRESGHYSGTRASTAICHASGIQAPPRPQEPYYAPPVSSVPPTYGAFNGQSSKPGPSQSQPPRPLELILSVETLAIWRFSCCGPRLSSCLISLSDFETRADLLLLSLVDFDVILGMDWLSPYYAIVYYHAKTLTLVMPGVPRVGWRGTLDHTPNRVISFLKVEKGCDSYLAYVRDVTIDTPTVDSVPVVMDFPDVFPADLSGMPPDRDIDFGIDLLSGTQPISIPLYHMTLPKLKELKERLQELFYKGFIQPSV
ncbi:uncharacterized protein [Nicotiana sylvestris]|uniref:uncharacterized protein n=1 Tax=Nicotiana sylvestris TaxID=4096 RepID=UPI00388C7E6C